MQVLLCIKRIKQISIRGITLNINLSMDDTEYSKFQICLWSLIKYF